MKGASILVLCVDRDDDLGRKTGIVGPVVGRENVLDAATRLGLADPFETDANCMFAAVKKFDEVTKEGDIAEVAVVTGVGKTDYASDKRISEQLDQIFGKINFDGIVLVTNGAEDDQVIPILQSYSRIISKQMVIVRQAKEVESTFYSIKDALKDNGLKTMFVVLPGTVLLVLAFLPEFSFSIISGSVGLLLLFYGTGLYDSLIGLGTDLKKNISIERTSLPFYAATFFVLGFSILNSANAYSTISKTVTADTLTRLIMSIQSSYFLLFMAAESFIVARSLDAIHLRKAYKLNSFLVAFVSILLLWAILDAGTQVFLNLVNIDWFLFVIIASFGIMILTLRASKSIDIQHKVTDLMLGAWVYTPLGQRVGKIEKTDSAKQTVEYKDFKAKKSNLLGLADFRLREGKVVLVK